MPIPWLAVLKIVPWSDVITNAPKVVDGAKKLWSTVSRKPAVQASPIEGSDFSSALSPGAEADNIAALMARIAAMEASAAELHNQMLASSELIQTLADQNAQLIKHIEDNRMRIKWLTRAAVIFGIVTILGLVLALAR
jgi:hypothetical protein